MISDETNPSDSAEIKKSAEKGKIKKIDSLTTFLIATAVLGPFALPLLWRNPRFKIRNKILGTLLVLALTYVLGEFLARFTQSQMEQFRALTN